MLEQTATIISIRDLSDDELLTETNNYEINKYKIQLEAAHKLLNELKDERKKRREHFITLRGRLRAIKMIIAVQKILLITSGFCIGMLTSMAVLFELFGRPNLMPVTSCIIAFYVMSGVLGAILLYLFNELDNRSDVLKFTERVRQSRQSINEVDEAIYRTGHVINSLNRKIDKKVRQERIHRYGM